MLKRLLFVLLSFLIVALGEPSRIAPLGIVSAALGSALFWQQILGFPWKKKFLWALCFFFGVTLVHLSYMTSVEFVGLPILGVYFLAALIMALQFALFSLVVQKKMEMRRILMLCGVWVLLEYSRHFMSCGYFWSPMGFALSGHAWSLQCVQWAGIYGLSFLSILSNLLFLTKKWKLWAASISLPFLLGGILYFYHAQQLEKHGEKMSVLLVQTAVLPNQKVHPIKQWQNIVSLLQGHYNKKIDLIVMPEGTVPYAALTPLYSSVYNYETFQQFFGYQSLKSIPRVEPPLGEGSLVSNAFWAQSIANLFQSEVIVGLEDSESGKAFQGAFLFRPGAFEKRVYAKQILVPIGEYIPFEWCKELAKKFGILGGFEKGTKTAVLNGKALSVCYEEACGQLVREGRKMGAHLLVNVTNDGWYPGERLPLYHYMHGRIRAVENGVPLLRACNTGITAGVDSLGREVAALPAEKWNQPQALSLLLPLYRFSTLYTFWGDSFILSLSSFCILGFLLAQKKELSYTLNSFLEMYHYRSRKRKSSYEK